MSSALDCNLGRKRTEAFQGPYCAQVLPKFYEAPITGSTVYPCTLEELRLAFDLLPPKDVDGLHSVGLEPSTRKIWHRNGIYYRYPEPKITLFSLDCSMQYSIKSPMGRARLNYAVETGFGMTLTQKDRWVVCTWDAMSYKLFMLAHVLPHEVGHHVHRFHKGYQYDAESYGKGETFAEQYALARQREGFHERVAAAIGASTKNLSP